MAHDEQLVRMGRAVNQQVKKPDWFPDSFIKLDGAPEVEFQGYQYFLFPTDHADFTPSGVIGNPFRATAEKGEKTLRALRRAPRGCAGGVPEGSGRRAYAEWRDRA